jgi:hypothetical protein
VPWWNSAALALRWQLMALGSAALVCLLPRHKRAPPTHAHLIGLAMIAYCLLSVLWTPVFIQSVDAICKLIILALVFVVGRRLATLKPVYVGIGAGMTVNSAVLIFQRITIGDHNDHFGLFWNPTLNGEAAVLVLAALMAEKQWLIGIGTWPSLILSGSRAALLSFAIVVMMQLWHAKYKYAAISALIGLLCLAVVGVLWGKPLLQSGERLDIWRDTVSGLTLFGHGLGSFWTTFPEHAHFHNIMKSRPEHAHNDYLELIYELGLGSILALWLAISSFRSAAHKERCVLVAFAVLATVGFPLYMPASAFIFAIVAGHAARGSPELLWAVVLRRERMVRGISAEAWSLPHPCTSG